MIKKEIKPFDFLVKEYRTFTGFVSPGVHTLELDTNNNQFVYIDTTLYPNTWQVNLGGNERLVLDADGDMRITGRIHALGSVIYNQETNRLNFWNGTEWLPFGPHII